MKRLILILICVFPLQLSALTFNSELHQFEIEVVADNLVHPWGMAFLPDGDILVTERDGKLLRVSEGKPAKRIHGLPKIHEHGQGGLLDVALHPDFKNNQTIYLSYAGKNNNGYGTEVLRAVLKKNTLQDSNVVFRLARKTDTAQHFGSRLVFAKDGTLFITLGDRGNRPRAQDLRDHAGSLIRINDDGTVPKDNPFVGKEYALPEIYTYGNRNMQGMTMHPVTGAIYTHEHGPQGGDELNLMRPGVNYGWPVITYGVNYVSATKIGEGTEKKGMQQPLHYWVPSIGPSGMTFYTGDEFPDWHGHLFIGSLIFGQLVRLELQGNKVVHEERMLEGRIGRIRDVGQGPDGTLYLLTDENRGLLVRLKRKQ